MQYMDTDAKILRGLLQEGECVSSYVLSGEYWCRYCITPNKNPDRIDISAALEETLHRLLDYGFNMDDIAKITGMVSEDACDSDSVISIDLGYCIPGLIVNFTPGLIDYKEAVKDWKVYIVRSYTPGNVTVAVTYACCEEMALRMMAKEYPNGSGWYAQELEVQDGITVVA